METWGLRWISDSTEMRHTHTPDVDVVYHTTRFEPQCMNLDYFGGPFVQWTWLWLGSCPSFFLVCKCGGRYHPRFICLPFFWYKEIRWNHHGDRWCIVSLTIHVSNWFRFSKFFQTPLWLFLETGTFWYYFKWALISGSHLRDPGKQWDIPKFVHVLFVNLEFPRSLVCSQQVMDFKTKM